MLTLMGMEKDIRERDSLFGSLLKRILSSKASFENILGQITSGLQEIFPEHSISIYIVNRGVLERHTPNPLAVRLPKKIPVDNGEVYYRLLEVKRPLYLEGRKVIEKHIRDVWGPKRLEQFREKEPLIEFLFLVPILEEKDPLGVLEVWSPNPIDSCERERYEVLVAHISAIKRRKRDRELLRESEERFRRLVENANDAIVSIDSSGKIVLWNTAAEKMFGYKREEAIGRSLTIIIPERFRRSHTGALQKIKLGEKGVRLLGQRVETLGIKRSGEEFPIELSLSVWEYGGETYYTAIIRDISARKETEMALRESEARFRGIVENSLMGIVIVDDKFRFQYVNEQFCKIFDVPEEDLIGKDFRELLDEESKKIVETFYIRRQRGEEVPHHYEVTVRTRSGEKRCIEVVASVIRDITGRLKTVAQVLDITEKKLAESKLKEQAQFLKDILDSLTHPFYVIDANDYTIKLANSAFGNLEKLKCRKCYCVTHNRDKPCSVYGESCPLEEVKKKKRPVILKHVHYDLEGGKSIYEVHGYPIFDDRGNVIQMIEYCLDISDREKVQEELRETIRKLQKAMRGTINAMARIVEMRDPYTAGHQQRVAELAVAIAKKLGLDEERIQAIQMAALIHDIGKIYIPAEILSKPARLSETEWKLMEAHPQVAYDILKTIDFPWPVAKIVLQHHERLNGSGYPHGLKGDEIMLEARILGVADVVEAMASHRPYRPAVGIKKALKEIKDKRGILYDPKVVDACLALFREGFKFNQSNFGDH
jgi:PAS domain S-box-containing protein/putative nucleotidyltransferase with HDIG domain